jgi:hypothetical protein
MRWVIFSVDQHSHAQHWPGAGLARECFKLKFTPEEEEWEAEQLVAAACVDFNSDIPFVCCTICWNHQYEIMESVSTYRTLLTTKRRMSSNFVVSSVYKRLVHYYITTQSQRLQSIPTIIWMWMEM